MRDQRLFPVCVVTGGKRWRKERNWVGEGGGGKEKFSYRLADKRRETRENGGCRARHLSGKGKRHDGISEIALDIFACISLSVQYHPSAFPRSPHLLFSPVKASTMPTPPPFLLSRFCQIVSRQRNTVEFIEEEKIDTDHVNILSWNNIFERYVYRV